MKDLAAVRFEVIPASHPDAIYAMTRYFTELDARFDGGFEPGDTLTADAPSMTAPAGAFVVARSDGAAVGCGGVIRMDDRTAEIKRMWVDPDWRGAGLGKRLLANLESQAAQLGVTIVRLDTNSALTEAIALYRGAGYYAIERYNDNPYARHWFEKRMTGW